MSSAWIGQWLTPRVVADVVGRLVRRERPKTHKVEHARRMFVGLDIMRNDVFLFFSFQPFHALLTKEVSMQADNINKQTNKQGHATSPPMIKYIKRPYTHNMVLCPWLSLPGNPRSPFSCFPVCPSLRTLLFLHFSMHNNHGRGC